MTGSTSRRRHPASSALAGIVVLGLLLMGCVGGTEQPIRSVRIATGPESESLLLARTIVALLEEAGIAAEPIAFADGRSARQAIELGDADLALAYTGEEWLMRLGRADPPSDASAAFEALAEADRSRGLVWLVPQFGAGTEEPPANATFAFFVAGPPGIDADLRTLSELSLRLAERPELSLCVDTEFGRREDGLAALLSAYSVRRDRPFLAADPSEVVARVLARDCVAGLSHATDGRAWRAGMQPLVDDLRFFPAFVPAPVIRRDTLEEIPDLEAALRPLLEGLSTGALGRANGALAAGGALEQVAEELAARLLASFRG